MTTSTGRSAICSGTGAVAPSRPRAPSRLRRPAAARRGLRAGRYCVVVTPDALDLLELIFKVLAAPGGVAVGLGTLRSRVRRPATTDGPPQEPRRGP